MKNKFWYFYTTFRNISTSFLSRKLRIVRIFTQIPSTRTLKIMYMTLNLGHTLKYDSKTQTFFFFNFLHHFHKNPTFTSFSDPPNDRIRYTKIFSAYTIWKYALLCPTKWKKNQNWFFGQFGWFSHVGSHISLQFCCNWSRSYFRSKLGHFVYKWCCALWKWELVAERSQIFYTRTSIIRLSIIQFHDYPSKILHRISPSYPSLNNRLIFY